VSGFLPTLRLATFGLLALVGSAWADEARTGWMELDTEHIVLKTDLGQKAAEEAVVRAEKYRAALLAGAWPGATPQQRTQLVVFSNYIDFRRYFGGLLREKVGFGIFPPTAFLFGAPDGASLKRALVNSLSPFFYRRQPRWFSAGLAGFLETLQLAEDGKSGLVGSTNAAALSDYANLRTFGVADAFAWGVTKDPHDEGSIRGLSGLSWLLVFWMYNTHPAEFARFQEMLGTGLEPMKAWTELFPDVENENLDRMLYQYAQYGDVSVARFSVPQVDVRIQRERPMTSAEVHLVRAAAAQAAGHLTETQEELSAARAADPDNIAVLRMQLSHPPTAEQTALARRATLARPGDGVAWLALGDALEASESREERALAYQKAMGLLPEHPDAYGALAVMAAEEGRKKEALALAQTAVRRAPWDGHFLDVFADALAAMGRCKDAMRTEERAADWAEGSTAGAAREARLANLQKRCVDAPTGKPLQVMLRLRVFTRARPFNDEYRFVLYDDGMVILQRASKQNIAEYFTAELTPKEVEALLGSLQLEDFFTLASEAKSPAATDLPLVKVAAYDQRAGKLREMTVSSSPGAAAEPAAFARIHQTLASYSNPHQRRWVPRFIYLSVTKASGAEGCNWPSDWEDLMSAGSMPIPQTSSAPTELGIIRARGERLSDVQLLLRACHDRFVLEGKTVQMKLAVTLPHEEEGG
jgi:tetratricopeptide (TPR) repeat protein